MSSDGFYRTPDADISQGDVFDGVPHLFLRPPLLALRLVTLAKDRTAYGFYPDEQDAPLGSVGHKAPPGSPLHFDTGEDVKASCVVTRAIALNYDCDLINDKKYRLVAMVRPLASLPLESQTIVRQNQNFNYFYLPPTDNLPESYVDFRRITSLGPEFIPHSKRVAALGAEAIRALQMQFFLFFTRRDLANETGA